MNAAEPTTDEQLANELVGDCPRCRRSVRLRWAYDLKARRNYRKITLHRVPGSRHTCPGTALEYKEQSHA